MQKMRVAVLRGGPSGEHDVSLRTGESVFNAIDAERYTPVDVVITRSGEWLLDGYSRFPEKILGSIDVVFNALHGTYGEDGTVQKLFETYRVPHTGSRSYPSRIAMHKGLTKEHLRDLGIKTAPHRIVSEDALSKIFTVSNSIIETFGPEYVVKPVSSGSSLGTTLVTNPLLLQQVLKETLGEHNAVIVEKRIRGREATCGLIEGYRGESHYVLPPIEIVPPKHAAFFDAIVKYDNSTEEICPGRFTRSEKKALMDTARKVHEALGLSQYSRSDFIIADDGIYFLEVNTLPGLTSESLFPKAIDAVGGTYEGFIDHLLTMALERR